MKPRKIRIKYSPVQKAVISWLDSLSPTLLESVADRVRIAATDEQGDAEQPRLNAKQALIDAKQVLIDRAPKRWVIYEPMALLPSGSFSSPAWRAILSSPAPPKEPLWTSILRELSPRRGPLLTHLAINEGIPLHLQKEETQTEGGEEAAEAPAAEAPPAENLLRAPTNLHPLYGFAAGVPSTTSPSAADFASALWVSTKQNGLIQTWAPQHTMFSRGNVKEKARLLEFRERHARLPEAQPRLIFPPHYSGPGAPVSAASRAPEVDPAVKSKWAVDLYAGIGYFAFCYAALGLRVLCWEVSPWSVEGLRRGAIANGFSVRVFSPSPLFSSPSPQAPPPSSTSPSSSSPPPPPSPPLETPPPPKSEPPPAPPSSLDDDPTFYAALGQEIADPAGAQIIVLHETNARALARLRRLRRPLPVLHVNCGFLPTSRPVWRDALEMVGAGLRYAAGRDRERDRGGRGTAAAAEAWGAGVDGGDGGSGFGGVGGQSGAWLHLHENVPEEELPPPPGKSVWELKARYAEKPLPRKGPVLELMRRRKAAKAAAEAAAADGEVVEPPPMRKDEVQRLFRGWMGETGRGMARVEHVEQVKTYAPGVMHCVFDVFVTGD